MKNKTIYIVTGLPRSGTSMMMQILQAGGLELCYDKNIDKERDKDPNWGEPDYHPNPNGYFEWFYLMAKINIPKFLKGIEGKAIKIIGKDILEHLPLGKYKIICMLRDEKERTHSMAKAYIKTRIPKGKLDADKALYFQKNMPFLFDRKDIEVLFVEYRSVIFNSKKEIQKVFKFLGLKLDLDKVILVVNSNLYRFRKENI